MVYLRLSLYLTPKNGLALITLADIYDRLKQNEEAIAVYEGVPDGSPLRTTADIQIAQLLDNLNKKAESAHYLEQIVAAHPDNEDALLALGNSQRNDKNSARPPRPIPRLCPSRRAREGRSGRSITSVASPTNATSNGTRPSPISARRSCSSPISRWS